MLRASQHDVTVAYTKHKGVGPNNWTTRMLSSKKMIEQRQEK